MQPHNLPTVQDLPSILRALQEYPFATAALLVAGWLVVQGIRHWPRSTKPPKK